MKYLFKVKWWMKLYSPFLIWQVPTPTKEVFITFDDGPTKGVTDKVVEILNDYNAKATFFCLGKNVESNEEIFQTLIENKHEIGNHTYDHPNGWSVTCERYMSSVNKCESVFESRFFRPPYGKLSPRKIKALRNRFQIVMWTLLSGDFDKDLSADFILNELIKETKPGDIIVFHDSEKAKENMLEVLPKYLKFLSENGYECNVLRPVSKKFKFF